METSEHNTETTHWKLFVDGASRNNPGPSGAGIYLVRNGKAILKRGFYVGIRTNNEAEYLALLLGFFLLDDHYRVGDTVRVISDSQLLVRQVLGEYRVKKEQLKLLYRVAYDMVARYDASLFHVLRTENTVADMMANQGVDLKTAPPEGFVDLLRRYNFTL